MLEVLKYIQTVPKKYKINISFESESPFVSKMILTVYKNGEYRFYYKNTIAFDISDASLDFGLTNEDIERRIIESIKHGIYTFEERDYGTYS